jgi:hypothetical protein
VVVGLDSLALDELSIPGEVCSRRHDQHVTVSNPVQVAAQQPPYCRRPNVTYASLYSCATAAITSLALALCSFSRTTTRL